MSPPSTILENGTKPCSHCGSVLALDRFYTTGKKRDGTPKYNSWCKQCVSQKQSAYHHRVWGPERLQFTAYKRTKTVRSYLGYLRAKAIQRGGACLSLDDLEMLWVAQAGKCALTGWPMTMELAKGVVPTNCSIDRIDSAKGYVTGNVHLVCRAANVAKHDLSQNDFLQLCRAVVEYKNG